MKIGGCVAPDGLRTSVVFLGIGLLITACGGGGGDQRQEAMIGDGTGSPMTELGVWNVPTPGALDVSDANNVLRAHYDSSGGGNLVVDGASVQPEGTGTATWRGGWSGKIDVDAAAAPALPLLGVTASGLQELSGEAVVTVDFNSDEVELTYKGIGLDSLGLSELASAVPLSDHGTFHPAVRIEIPLGTNGIMATGYFTGVGGFGGANAEGVAGFVGGGIDAPGLGTGSFGDFKSVFYGDKDPN